MKPNLTIGRIAIRTQLELRFSLALIIVFVVSIALLLPGLIYRPIWKKYQNRTVDWAEEWGFEPVRQYLNARPYC